MQLPMPWRSCHIGISEKVEAGTEKPKKDYWTYGQKNAFRFVEFMKRAPFVEPASQTSQILWAEKDFICASESFRPGSYVVFLQSVEPNEWIPVNHYMGGLRIEKNVVTWPYDEMMGSRRSLDSAKAAVLKAKVSVGQVRFRAGIVGSFWGLYNRWMPSRSHQVLVFHLMERALPSPWPAEHLFARAVVPREIAGREEYESWVKTEGRLEATANWVDGSLVIKEARRIGGI